MAYDGNLASRVALILSDEPDLSEKKMFGGIGYLLNGNMACGVYNQYLIVRVGPEAYQDALSRSHTRVFDITGRPMTGWVMVSPEGCESEQELASWVARGIQFVLTLPPK